MEYGFYGSETAEAKPILPEWAAIENPRVLYEMLCDIWCVETCAPRLRDEWSKENATVGQCSVTSFLAQDIFGGKVRGILRPGGNFHCYNDVAGCVFDLTSEQFTGEVLHYSKSDPVQERTIHFADMEKRLRYQKLWRLLRKKIGLK